MTTFKVFQRGREKGETERGGGYDFELLTCHVCTIQFLVVLYHEIERQVKFPAGMNKVLCYVMLCYVLLCCRELDCIILSAICHGQGCIILSVIRQVQGCIILSVTCHGQGCIILSVTCQG